ncbi:hypothetical protein [Rhodopirellula sp. SWK7]|uniref:hypothetical protein n=1 Tax=Rhodopirellula sp. SWK7 TaxID=595460 RepID=UPI0002C03AE4|nr:hypothetical protein [Rhodopirellula sp. SWK7]EMI47017.1 hypothetical protein RRSWK_00673 [Rhodopirellula sp. SWK7]
MTDFQNSQQNQGALQSRAYSPSSENAFSHDAAQLATYGRILIDAIRRSLPSSRDPSRLFSMLTML